MKSASGIDRAELRDTPRIRPPRTRLLSSLDLKLLVLAFLLTGFTLAYPFGRDQGLFDVVGREWFRYGAVPYRDLVEQKPPPIFVVHGLLNLLLGDQTWGIRAFDLALTFVAGASLACLAAPRTRRTPGLVGFGAFALAIVHYGFYSYWDTAQVDWTAAAFAVIALASVERLERSWTLVLVGGLGVGLGRADEADRRHVRDPRRRRARARRSSTNPLASWSRHRAPRPSTARHGSRSARPTSRSSRPDRSGSSSFRRAAERGVLVACERRRCKVATLARSGTPSRCFATPEPIPV